MMNILLTGAGTGVGKETAKAFASEVKSPVRIFIVARNTSRLEQTAREITQLNSVAEVIVIPADISTEEGIQSVAETVQKHTDSLEILINNAGHLHLAPAAELSLSDYLSVYSTNVFGPALLCGKLFSPLRNGKLVEGKLAAHVVNISSMGGVQGALKFSGLSAYSSSKGAILTLTECLAEEWSKENIRVNALAIGSVNTEMFRVAFPGSRAATEADVMGKFIADFALKAGILMNGKIVQVSASTP